MTIAHLCLSCFYIDGYNYQENVLPRQNRRDGHDVVIIASTETFSPDRKLTYTAPGRYVNEDGIPVVRLPYRRGMPHAAARKLRRHPGVFQLLEEYRPDVILFHGLCGWELLTAAAYVDRHPGVVLYADSHEDAHNSGLGFVSRHLLHRGYYRSILRRALPRIRKVLYVTPETLDFVTECYGLAPSQLEFYPLGGEVLSDEEYHERRQRVRRGLGLREDHVVLVQAGKMDAKKKLVETLRTLRANAFHNLHLLIIGSLDDEIRGRVETLLPTVPNAHYLGWKDAPALLDHLCAADVYVQPGTQSATMQNALCARCPVVLDDVPSHRPFVDGNGWLLNANQSLEGVLRAIDHDPARLDAMSRRSLAIATDLLDYRKLAARLYREGPGRAPARAGATLMRPAAARRTSTTMRTAGYQICTTCIMDTSDPRITFGSDGTCDYCANFRTQILPSWDTGPAGERALQDIARRIKDSGKGKDFDCIIGISGGLDSSFAAHVARTRMGLRPLLFHVDAGWNTDQAVGNIERLVDGLGLDLYTEVVDWEEMKDLQVAMLRSQIADQDIPQDAAFFSGLYRFARKHRLRYVLTGSNYSTECCREPEEWGAYPGIDETLIRDIHARFGKRPLRTFPLTDVLTYKLYYRYVLGMRVVKPLNFIPYVKADAEAELERLYGWKRFQHKHHESRFTRFYEDYWMPRKFGYEKRRAHFSSLIMTGQMSRAEALERMRRPEMDDLYFKQEFEYVAHKLGLSVDELERIFKGENRTYRDYRNKRWAIGLGATAMTALGLEKRLFR